MTLWEWLSGLSGGAGNFVGAFTGAVIGLIALLLGALFNAHLNRMRDDRLRREDTRALAAALRADLGGVKRTLLENSKSLKTPRGDYYVPDLSHSLRVLPHVLPKLGLLKVETIGLIIDAYILIDQYCEKLLMMGGQLQTQVPPHRRLVIMKEETATRVAALNDVLAGMIDKAGLDLDQYLY
jgi:hypothetical protein